MYMIWSFILISLLILIFISRIGKKIIFEQENVKPKWLRFIIFPYISIPLIFMFSTFCFFLEDGVFFLEYFLEISSSYKEISYGLKIVSNISSFLFSLSNLYVVTALFVFLFCRGYFKLIFIPIIYILTYPFVWFLTISLLGYYMVGIDINKFVNLQEVLLNKLMYVGYVLGYPVLIYVLFIIIILIIFYENRYT